MTAPPLIAPKLASAGYPYPWTDSKNIPPNDGRSRQRHFKDGDELCEYMREKTGPKVILWFSNGKDSLATWLQLRKHFEVIPFYGYCVPGLSFIEETLRRYEDFFKTRIIRVPNGAFLKMLDEGTWQVPRTRQFWKEQEIMYDLETAHVVDNIRNKFQCPGAFSAMGFRAADSMHRRNAISKWGPIVFEPDTEYRMFYPAFDWKTEDMVREFTAAKLQLPVDYALWNRSFDSPRARFLIDLKERFPDDYRRLRFWFPAIDVERKRREFWRKDPR